MVALLIGFVLALTFTHPAWLAALMLLVLIPAVWARALASLGRVGKPMLVLFLVTALLWSFLRKGQTPLLGLGPFHVSGNPCCTGSAWD